ncbi:MAG TPA: class II glutamine amidotransferase [Longimicrobiales bacterium]|nr:class II glutamine amidotransferase [Longimicrobiales bacterium]
MCRFTLYLGPPVRLSTLLTEPEHSLIRQSYQSQERSEPLNGDGFGIGWYAPRISQEPALFHQITPAWNNRSLQSIAKVVCSPCIMAHVRAATPGSDVNLANCHPFGYGGYLLMHNGHVGGFRKIRRQLLDSLSDEAFDVPRGSTDTEHLFAVFVDELLRNGCSVEPGAASASDGEGALELARRLSTAIARVLALSEERGDGESSFLNVAVADGSHVAVCRFDTDPEERPESLYLFHGEMYEPAGRRFPERRKDDDGEAMVVSSERLTGDPRWMAVPPNSMLVLDRHAAPRVLPMDDFGRLADA